MAILGDMLTIDNSENNSPSFTGIPTAPTAPIGTSTTQIATTEFVYNAIAQALNEFLQENNNN